MATIYIYPGAPNTGVDFSAPNAAAYAALAGGGAANTVVLESGYSYLPDRDTGRWWGRDQRYGLDKRVEVVTSGSGPVWLTSLVYVTSANAAVYLGDGVWRVDVIDESTANAPGIDQELYVGASYSEAASGVEIGWRRPPADSQANVSAEGETLAGQIAGKGIWYCDKSGSVVRLYIWCPTGESVHPAACWGGIALSVRSTGGGGPGCTPLNHAFVYKGTASNDPSGSSVTGDVRVIGSLYALAGTPRGDSSDAYSSISNITFSGLQMYGRGSILLESRTASTVIDGVRFTDGWLLDDRIDPSDFHSTTANEDLFEQVQIGYRVRNCVFERGTILAGLSHGLLSLTPTDGGSYDGTGAEEDRSTDNTARQLVLTARDGSDGTNVRAFAVRKTYRTLIEQCAFHNFSTISKLSGSDTRFHLCTMSGGHVAAAETDPTDSAGNAYVAFETLNATEDANMQVALRDNVFDQRGDAGVNGFAALQFIANTGGTVPAGAVTAVGNVFLSDAGTVACRVKLFGTGAVNSNQTWASNKHSQDETSYAASGESGLGTVQAASTTFSTGTVSGNITDTADNILARGDLPARALAIGLPV